MCPNILPDNLVSHGAIPIYGITQLGLRSHPLGCLHLRPLQRHIHSLGLTKQFSPLRRLDPLVLVTLFRQWQDLSFITSGIPIQPFQAEFTIFTDASTQGWGTHMGNSQIADVWTCSQLELHISLLELRVVLLALKYCNPVMEGQ